MERDRWTRVLIIMLVVIASIYLLEKAWQLIGTLQDIILLFTLALLVTFILHPLVEWLSEHPIPQLFIALVRHRWRKDVADLLEGIRLPHGLAVAVVYLGLLVVILLTGILLIPVIVAQLSQLGANMPQYIARIPSLLEALQNELTKLNVDVDLMTIYHPQELTARAESLGTTIIQNALVIATGVASTVVNVLLILALSFYMALDGERIVSQSPNLIPSDYYEETVFVIRRMGRILGGLIRGYLVVSLLSALGTMFIMLVAGLNFVLLIGIFAGFMTPIPIVGAPVAIILPVIIALVQSPGWTLWILLLLILYQQILLHFLLPKIISEAADLPVLLILGAMVAGFALLGFWGFLFGIPIAAVIYAAALSYQDRLGKRRAEELAVSPATATAEAAASPALAKKSPAIMAGAEPFLFKGHSTGCLLLHGFTGTPAEMREMGEYLAGRGLTVLGVRLAGHGTTLEDMEQTTWQDWYASAQDGLLKLSKECDEVFIAGLSLGGGLALYLAGRYRLAGLVTMAAPVNLNDDWRLRHIRYLKHVIRFSAKGPDDFHDPTAVRRHIGYKRVPSRCTESLLQFLNRLNDDLPKVQVPALLMHSKHDTMVPPNNMPYIHRRIRSADKEMVWLDNSGHVITEDCDKLIVFERTYRFMREHSLRLTGEERTWTPRVESIPRKLKG